jgi:hypothetical protein
MAKSSNNILALGVGLNLDPLNQDIANAAKTAKEGMATLGQSVADGGAKASGATEKLGDKVQTMRQQLRQATQDTQAMAEKFGVMSTQAIASAARAGDLKDKIGDINTVITAFSADSKFTVVAGAMQSAAGAATIVTGAMGLLGTESKATQEMLLKVQSALALTQGLAQIKEMGASFTALNAVIVGQVIPGIAAMSSGLLLATGGAILIIGAIAYAVNEYRINLQKNEEQLALNAQRERDYAEAIRNSKQELIQKTIALRDELTALKEGVTIDEVQIRNKEEQVIAFNALIKQYKEHNDKIRAENVLKFERLRTENALIALVGGQKKTESDLGIIQEKNTRGLETKVQLLKDEIEQGRIQLGLSKEIKTIQDKPKNDKAAADAKLAQIQYLIDLNKFETQQIADANKLADEKAKLAPKLARLQTPMLPGLGASGYKFGAEKQLDLPLTFSINNIKLAADLDGAGKLAIQKLEYINSQIKAIVVPAMISALSGLGEGIAGALSGDNDPFEAFGIGLIKSLGAMAVQLGTQLLLIGLGLQVIPGLQFNAGLYMAGGAALIVAGSAMSGLAGRKSQPSKTTTPSPVGGGGGNNSSMGNFSNYNNGLSAGDNGIRVTGRISGRDIIISNNQTLRGQGRSTNIG